MKIFSDQKTAKLQSWTKVLVSVLQYSYFSVISLFPLKTVHPFLNFHVFLPPPSLYKVETRKKFGIHASSIVCGVRGGVGLVWIGKRPRNAKVSQDFCPWLKLQKAILGKIYRSEWVESSLSQPFKWRLLLINLHANWNLFLIMGARAV